MNENNILEKKNQIKKNIANITNHKDCRDKTEQLCQKLD